MPSTSAGTKVDAASENEADTSGRMSAGLREATTAASRAVSNSANLDRITRCSGFMRVATSWLYRSRTMALLMVSSRPSAVDSAAARPPAATSAETM
jgi:hypothetical protein